jgi:cytoskeletal protein RodZ
MNDENSVLNLAAIRRNRGISLQQIADVTKIGVRALESIEREDFRSLPGGIYSTSYIRQYARAIDYDESAILDIYYRHAARANGDSARRASNGVYSGCRAPSPAGS